MPDGQGLGELGSPPSMAVDFTFPIQYEGRVVAVLEFVTDGMVRPAEAVELCEQVGTQLVRVAERELASRELTAARDAALAAAHVKSAFLATMSHEIRTPMNGVIGLTDLLLGTELTDRQRQYAEGVHGAGEALLAIINDILDFSKVEAGKLELEVIDFDVTQIVEEVASLVARQAHSKGLELICHASLGLSTTLRGDPARIRQVLLNLTSNGIKFTEQGDVMLRAWVVSETDTEVRVQFEVSDTGMGIDPEDQQRLFHAFSQIDASTTRRFGGTGLGLAISTQLVEAMGGQLTVVSAVGEGSTFTFTLTLARGESLRGPAPLPGEHLLDGVPVLVVGGSATSRLILHDQLAGWDMKPQLATSGAAALHRLHTAAQQNHPIPVALIDVILPGMSGIELARRIGQDPVLGQTRVRDSDLDRRDRRRESSPCLGVPQQTGPFLTALRLPGEGSGARPDRRPPTHRRGWAPPRRRTRRRSSDACSSPRTTPPTNWSLGRCSASSAIGSISPPTASRPSPRSSEPAMRPY